ncbi:MAG: glycosyltransferase family 4 protein [Anaerolineales bacterium]|nr:glycosyltransferase family 4 protein [Anaerolineales bacterium]
MASVRPRIAVISDTAPPTSGGGVGVAHYNLVRALRQRGCEAQLFVFFERGGASVADSLLRTAVHRFGPAARLQKVMLLLNKWLFALLAPGKTAWNTVDIFASWPGMRKLNKALARFDPDHIVVPDHGAPALWLRASRRAQITLVAHHNPMRLATMDLDTYSELDARWAVSLEQRSLPKISKVISPSHHMQDWFKKTYTFGGPQTVIPNIVIAEDLAQVPVVDLRPRLGLPADALLVCVPSAQTVVKGSRMLPGVLAGLASQVRRPLGVFLPGELDPEMQKSLPGLPENVRLYAPGRLTWEEYIAFLKSCSLGLFLSLRDNYSMALVEAACCGVPMLAFDAGGNADIIESGVNGLLIDAASPEQMVQTALGLFKAPGQLKSLQQRTRTDAQYRFDSQRVVQQYLDFLGIEE